MYFTAKLLQADDMEVVGAPRKAALTLPYIKFHLTYIGYNGSQNRR